MAPQPDTIGTPKSGSASTDETRLLQDEAAVDAAETRLIGDEADPLATEEADADEQAPLAADAGGADEQAPLAADAEDEQAPESSGEPIAETVLFPKPIPSYDEETGVGMGDLFVPDYSHLDQVPHETESPELILPSKGGEDGAGYRIPGEGRSRSRWRPLMAFFLVGLMACIIVAAGSYGLGLWGGTRVPNVGGLTESRARSMLEGEGFVVETKTRLADDAIGFVIEQDPERGVRLGKGSTVTITIAVARTMPEVIGLTEEEAQDLLAKAGAKTVVVEGVNSAEPEGTVVGVDPGVGEAFVASQDVILRVAQKAPVPDVIGLDRVEAVAKIEESGFRAEVVFGTSDAQEGTVFECSPEPGAKAEPDSTVTIKVSESLPESPLHIAEYFGKDSANIATYLEGKGFSLVSGSQTQAGYAEGVYHADGQGYLIFCDRPFSHQHSHDGGGENPLAAGLPFEGIRWEVPSNLLPGDASDLSKDSATKAIMQMCGLANVSDVCTEGDVQMPADSVKTDAKFRCSYGESSGCSWTVLIVVEGGATRAAVTCAPTEYYEEYYDTSAYGGSLCDMIAYADVYSEL